MSDFPGSGDAQQSSYIGFREPPPPYNPIGFEQGVQVQPQYTTQQPGVHGVQNPQGQAELNVKPYPMHTAPVIAPQRVVVGTPAVLVLQQPMSLALHSMPAQITCASCHATSFTRTERSYGSKTHVIAIMLCILGCWPCCLFPYCMDDCQDTSHFCSNCGAYQGISKY